MDDLIGKNLNRFQILELLGKGGVGSVYKAYDSVLQRNVAIKVLDPKLVERPNFRDRFLQEARMAARLDHPGIVRVHSFDQQQGLLYIVMEYIPGDNLRKLLRDLRAQKKWVILSEAVQIVQQVSEALHYAHAQGVLHRDIKPDNLMLKPEPTDGLPYRIVITDLGLAQLSTSLQEGDSHESMGTPAYMSPEQTRGEPATVRSDVYSLGILLYELAVGRLPFPASTLEEARRMHNTEPVPAPRGIRADLPVALETVILKALEKDPSRRFENAQEFGRALDDVIPAVTEVVVVPDDLSDTVSLVTQYDLTRNEPRGFQASQPRDLLEVTLPDGTVRNLPIPAGGLAIGRDPDNDLVLDLPKVSRRHARLQFDGHQYWITDLNSKNGTYLGSKHLASAEPEAWTGDQPVQIGEAWLRLKRSGSIPTGLERTQPPVVVAPTQAATTYAGDVTMPPSVGHAAVSIFMETVQLAVTPGNSATISFMIMNRSQSAGQFRVSVTGIPAQWIPTPPALLQIPAGGQREVRVNVQPPATAQSKPGRYQFTVRATSLENPDRFAEVEGTLNLGVYSRFSTEMRPRRLEANETFLITVQNQGNARTTFTLSPTDRYEELVFDPPQAQFSLAEGEAASAEFLVAPRRRRLFGSSRLTPFSVQINTPNGQAQTQTGELGNSGIFPPIVLPLLLILCLCAAATAAYGYAGFLRGPTTARQTSVAATQFAAQTQAALESANLPTIQAATATAAWIMADNDGDGLANGDEIRFQSDPNNSDTDNDGVSDGVEVAILKCTSPIKADTDNDGLSDKDDPAPCEASTATVTTPTPTMTGTGTPTPSLTPTQTNTPPTPSITPTNTPTPTATPSPTATATEAVVTPVGGSTIVYFTSGRDGNYQIYAMLPDGNQQTRLTNNGTNDMQPAISPDSTHVAFVTDRDGNSQIYLMNSDGSGQINLSNNQFNDTSPAWSADGTRMAFISDRDGQREVYLMNTDGSGQTRLTNTPADEDHPAWAPDGSRLVFDATSAGAGRAIMLINADGTGLTDLTRNLGDNYEPSYSPNGSLIAYISDIEGNPDVYRMNADGTGQTRLVQVDGSAANPQFSKDGQWVIFEVQQGGAGEIHVVNIDGTGHQNLTNNTADDGQPTW